MASFPGCSLISLIFCSFRLSSLCFCLLSGVGVQFRAVFAHQMRDELFHNLVAQFVGYSMRSNSPGFSTSMLSLSIKPDPIKGLGSGSRSRRCVLLLSRTSQTR